MEPFVSIITPTYNRAYCIGNAIKSVLEQNYQNFEIIIIDDGSTDSTEEVVRKFRDERLIYLKQSRNTGVNKAKNAGIKASKGKYIIFLDSDDQLLEGALSYIADTFERIPDSVGVIWGACVDLDGNITSSNPNFCGILKYEDLVCQKLVGEYIPICKREALEYEKFDENLISFEGITWIAISRKFDFYITNTPLRLYDNKGVDRLSHAENIIRRASKMVDGKKILLARFSEDMLRLCPNTYIRTVHRLILYLIIDGNRKEAIKYLLECIKRDRLNVNSLILLVLLLLGKRVTQTFYRIKQKYSR